MLCPVALSEEARGVAQLVCTVLFMTEYAPVVCTGSYLTVLCLNVLLGGSERRDSAGVYIVVYDRVRSDGVYRVIPHGPMSQCTSRKK